MADEKYEKMIALSEEVLKLSRNTILVNLRFLDSALARLVHMPTKARGLFTDGTRVLFSPGYILNSFTKEKEMPVRDYLHIILHCVFRHMYMSSGVNREYWDLACDIAVESVICEFGMKSASCSRENMQIPYIIDLKLKIKKLTAERIYRFLTEKKPSGDQLKRLKEAFCGDDHEIWYMPPEVANKAFGVSGTSGDSESEHREAYEAWSEISMGIEMEVEEFLKKRGNNGGSLTQNLKEVNREKYDYTLFLKKFAVIGETMKINDDEFDYIFYTYGMELYKNMPLVEPLEYKEVKKIKDFVVAIDTSGSTSGELVQKFVQKTYNILKSTESFFSKINLYIIQCDAEIQEVVKIRTTEEFDKYLNTMKIRGLGGTDFRPVFQYVNDLIEKKELVNLKGMIYLTDGHGVFPKIKPKYESAFVFIDDDYNNYDVPPWAIKLILQKDEI